MFYSDLLKLVPVPRPGMLVGLPFFLLLVDIQSEAARKEYFAFGLNDVFREMPCSLLTVQLAFVFMHCVWWRFGLQ